ncbi:MAG: Altered inheritance of mitochondria protein 18 mitochondrial [Pycnora praestabilis]|nr:MAG: Altered inheritance of mitochondria protein 18 mitochondrial [Pycnora praestabilis]
MNLHPTTRLLRRPLIQCLHQPPTPPIRSLIHSQRFASTSRRSSSSSSSTTPHEPLDPITLHRLETERRAYYARRSYYAAAGAIICMLATVGLATTIDLPPKPEHNDAGPNDPMGRLERGTPVVGGVSGGAEIRKSGPDGTAGPSSTHSSDEVEQIPTGTSTIPLFPKTLSMDTEVDGGSGKLPVTAEYQLLGLGIRTVSFLSIQVYVVGLYIATDDIDALQKALVRRIDPIATTLVKDEKDRLKAMLLDPERSEEIWSDVLKEAGIRTVIRIVPTRNTDFQHLRDGWVRGITARTQRKEMAKEFEDEGFQSAIKDFKDIFSRGQRKSVPKAKTLLLTRDQKGALGVLYDDNSEGKEGPVRMGGVGDERISKCIWLGYLAGKNVSSEGARKSVVDGVMEFVERPVGTVGTQVI